MFNDKTFVYVEDDPMSRKALELILTRVMGIGNVHIFPDSTDFMEKVHALPQHPDLFLLDIHVPPYSGFEMLKMLRADTAYANARIVALTASVMNEEVALLRDSGFDGVCGKPIDIANFPSVIERILGGEKVWHVTES